jgi:HEPN domain-containing protein
MKLSDMPTPIADEIWDRYSEDGDDFSFTMYLSHQAVEKKLALAVAALKDIRVRTHDSVAREALAQIEKS